MLIKALILIGLVLIVTPLVFLMCLKLLGPFLRVTPAVDAPLNPLLKTLSQRFRNVIVWLWDYFKF